MLYGIQEKLHHGALECAPFRLIDAVGIVKVGRDKICIEHDFKRVGFTGKTTLFKFVCRMIHTAVH